MNKADLIAAMAAESGLSKVDSKKALDAFLAATTKALKRGERVTLVGFGSFVVGERGERMGRNPRT
ncbi:MAG: HU family DNA-binding protein, partial [Bacteroidales bacterium]|nr:HU family DNA-binding protein [Bacteroidales bacterium]